MTASHDARVARANTLARDNPASAPLLNFYAELARFQKPVFAELNSKSGTDLRALVCHFPALMKLVSRSGTELLANFAAENLLGTDAQLELLSASLRRISRVARRHPGQRRRAHLSVLQRASCCRGPTWRGQWRKALVIVLALFY